MKFSSLTRVMSLILVLGACHSSDKVESVVEAHNGPQGLDPPSTHGMLMVGDGPVYLSHLPMFHKPHDYQVLLEVDLVKSGADPVAVYAQDRQTTGEKIYTIVPQKFSLPELFTPDGAPMRTTFTADLFRGHFERGGAMFMSGVTVQVKKVILAKRFLANPAPLPNLQYFVFGNAKELFAAHIVNMKPDFDHVVSVRLTEGVLTEAQAAAIRGGVTLDFAGVENVVGQAVKEGQDYVATGKVLGEQLSVNLHVITDFYLETGDLEE